MVQKLQEIKTSIEKRLDKLTSMYGDGLVDGFSQQLLAILDGTFLRVSCIKFTSCNSRWVGGRVFLTVTCHTRKNPEGIKYEVHKCFNSQPNGLIFSTVVLQKEVVSSVNFTTFKIIPCFETARIARMIEA